jgi:hypothetical protein
MKDFTCSYCLPLPSWRFRRVDEEKATKWWSTKQAQMQTAPAEKVLRTYRIALGVQPGGAQRQEGDEKTPEGAYVLDWRNPNSIYYNPFTFHYPKRAGRKQASACACPRRRHHGPRPQRIRWFPDGTRVEGLGPMAAIAVTNAEMTKSGEWSKTARTIQINP